MRKILYSFFVLFLLALVIGVMTIAVCQFHVQAGNDMQPTLADGDHVMGIRHVPIWKVRRGDVVAFYLPQDPTQIAVRRVVGLPGDHIQVKHGRLVLNGALIDEPYVQLKDSGGLDFPSPTVESLVDEGGPVRRLQTVMYGEWIKDGVLIVPADYYFLLGDNRNHSLDSRDFGPVQESAIYARPAFVYMAREPWKSRHAIQRYVVETPAK